MTNNNPKQSPEPSAPQKGQRYRDSTTGQVKEYTGSVWTIISPKQLAKEKAQRQRTMAQNIMKTLVECTDNPREACKILMTAIGGVISMGGLKFGKKVEAYTYKELETMLKTIVKVCFRNQRKRLKKESKNLTSI